MDIFAPWHLLILLLIVIVIFGPSKIGDVGGALGRAIRDFKKAMNEPEQSPQANRSTTPNGPPGSESAVVEAKSDKSV